MTIMTGLTVTSDVRGADSVPGPGHPLPAGWTRLDHHRLLLDLQLQAATRPRLRPRQPRLLVFLRIADNPKCSDGFLDMFQDLCHPLLGSGLGKRLDGYW